LGHIAGYHNTSGNFNTYVGYNANCGSGDTFNYSTAIGYYSKITKSNQIVLGGDGGQSENTTHPDVYIPGDLGIGTTDPSTPLHVIASSNTDPDQNGIYVSNPANNSTNEHAIIGVRVGGEYAGNPYISYDVLDTAGWSTGIDNSDGQKFKISAEWASLSASTRLTITTDGNVGIGTTEPKGRLHIYESVGTTTGSNDGTHATCGSLVIEHGDSGGASSIVFPSAVNKESDYGYIKYQDDISYGSTYSEDERSLLIIGTQNDTHGNNNHDSIALMPSSGSVGIGTTSPVYTLDVNGSVQATSYNATSDMRHKENICDLENSLEKINTIRGVNFNFKNDDKIHSGIIAQEVAEIIPEAICKSDDEKWSANYNTFIGYLIESVKTLSKENETLKTKVGSLESTVGSLESKLDMVMQHLNL
jgi:hypothetical protein